ncbi:UNVERIFIED_CONTAM: hypothetical protein NCL1_43687 [Trichonephila clavipes]
MVMKLRLAHIFVQQSYHNCILYSSPDRKYANKLFITSVYFEVSYLNNIHSIEIYFLCFKH